jgi:transposase-like protein
MLCRRRHNTHLIRNTFRLASRRDWDAPKRDMKPLYTALNAAAAQAALDELTEKCGTRYPAIIRSWNNAWEEFIPFLDGLGIADLARPQALTDVGMTRSRT